MDFIGTNHLDLNQNPVATMPSAIDLESNQPFGIISAIAGTIVLRPVLSFVILIFYAERSK